MKHRIVAIGEVLWDLLPGGRQLGGTPANFAIHAHALGADARLISRVGDDELGREVLDAFRRRDMPTDSIDEYPRTVSNAGLAYANVPSDATTRMMSDACCTNARNRRSL